MARRTATRTGKTNKARKPRKPTGMTGLDAAAKVLAENGRPLGVRQIVETMLQKRDWKTGGQTPYATISSAIQRDIKSKKADSRFRKAGPGNYGLRPDGK